MYFNATTMRVSNPCVSIYVPHGCVTARLHNLTPSGTIGRPDVLPESLPILLLNRVDLPTQLNDSLHHIAFCIVCMPL